MENIIFHINKEPYNEKKTDSISNVLIKKHRSVNFLQINLFNKLYKSGKAEEYPESKGRMKKVFGRQLTTVIYSHRNWIWTFSTEPDKKGKAVIYALVSVRGCHWECDRTSNKKYLFKLFKDVLKHIEDNI